MEFSDEPTPPRECYLKMRCRKKKFSCTEDINGVVLNYFTQSISEPLAQKDFLDQKNMAQNKKEFFWAIQALFAIYVLLQIATIFWDKPNKIGIVGITNAIIWLSIIWPIVSYRFPRFTRWVFVCFYLSTTVISLIIQWTKDEDSILFQKAGYG